MPKCLIEREIPGAGNMSADDLKAASATSCGALSRIGPSIQWVESFVTGDKIYCIYIAPSEKQIEQHAELSGFPANRISEIATVIDPTTAD